MSSFGDNLTDLLVVGAFPLAILLAVYKFWNSGRICIPNPKLGLLNIGGDEFAAELNEDRKALGAFFNDVIVGGEGQVPNCDVLFVYAKVASNGSIANSTEPSLRHLAARAGSVVLVLASNNPSEHVVAAGKVPGPKQCSLVLTLDRNGEGFPRFFKEVFTLMKSGKTMPMAWIKTAPQHKSVMPQYTPETIFLPEGKFVVFK